MTNSGISSDEAGTQGLTNSVPSTNEAYAVLPSAQSLAYRGADEALLPGVQGLVNSETDEGELINISSGSSSDEEDEANSSAISTSNSEVLTTNCPNDIAQTAAFPPAQPANIRFPTTIISGKARSFNSVWYGMHKWLEYSVESDAISEALFCKC